MPRALPKQASEQGVPFRGGVTQHSPNVRPMPPLRRRVDFVHAADGSSSIRRRRGAIVLALLAVVALIYLRSGYDASLGVLWIEQVLCSSLIMLSYRLGRKSPANSESLSVHGLAVASIGLPWLMEPVARSFGSGNPNEILLLSSLAWGGVALAVVGRPRRSLDLSVVCSGFLTLFTTFISDQSFSVFLASAWGAACLWWLVANQWERIEACAASRIERSSSQTWLAVGLGVVVFVSASAGMAGRIPVLHRLSAGLAPTSGGTRWNDPSARSGVGSGDALVAAREHAATFGAVDTDFFLDSPQQSLFDLFNDQFGEAQKKKDIGRAQALSSENTRSQEGQFAKANRSSSDSFSTQRDAPPTRRPLRDLESEAIMFWHGPPGVRLAIERYHEFDGVEWHRAMHSDQGDIPDRIQIGETTWFRPNGLLVQNALSPFVGVSSEAIKFTRYRSTLIPTRPGLQLWSIDRLDRADFFSLAADGDLCMPGRPYVPDDTVVRFVNSHMDLRRLEALITNCSPGKPHLEISADCKSAISRLAHRYADALPRGWDQVAAVMRGLRRDFELKTTGTLEGRSPIEEFLTSRQGPCYLFATTAALMLEHLGYEVRLATGFYVNPQRATEGDFAVLPQDAHVWLEMNVGHGYWVPLEPSPGFTPPRYTTTLWYRLYKARTTILSAVFLTVALGVSMYLARRRLLEIFVAALWPLATWFGDRHRTRWLARILDLRLRLADRSRHPGTLPRDQFLGELVASSVGLRQQLVHFFDEADRLWFGGGNQLSSAGRSALKELWLGLTVGRIRAELDKKPISGTVPGASRNPTTQA